MSVENTRAVVWISGASSGIGAALARSVPFAGARVIGISRRAPEIGEHVAADLADPASWPSVVASFEAELSGHANGRALFLHFAGDGAPHGHTIDADPDRYAASVLLNAASGQILGQRFLQACRDAGVHATLAVCSSPAALFAHRGTAQYAAGKAALLQWTEIVRAEESPRGSVVFAVIPWATDTAMLRDAIRQPVETNPLSGEISALAAAGGLATAEEVAAEIWRGVAAGGAVSPLHVGPAPEEFRSLGG